MNDIHAIEALLAAGDIGKMNPDQRVAYYKALCESTGLNPVAQPFEYLVLKGKTVLPLATGGSPHHMLALDYALRPVLQSLGAKNILPGIYATDAQVIVTPEGGYQVAEDIGARLDEAVDTLVVENLIQGLSNAGRFKSVPFSEVRCSV